MNDNRFPSRRTRARAAPPLLLGQLRRVGRERLFLDEPVDLVGITASTPSAWRAYRLADAFRRRGAKVVLGGHHATALPEEALGHADVVVCGEGETSWARICEQMLVRPANVAGVYRDPAPDLATLPLPRTDLVRLDRYQPYSYPIIGSRGCPERCSFCFAKRMTKEFRTYPIAHVLEQVRRRPAWTRAIYFVDDNLPGDPDWARALFRALAKEPVRIPFGHAGAPRIRRLRGGSGARIGRRLWARVVRIRVGEPGHAGRHEQARPRARVQGMHPAHPARGHATGRSASTRTAPTSFGERSTSSTTRI